MLYNVFLNSYLTAAFSVSSCSFGAMQILQTYIEYSLNEEIFAEIKTVKFLGGILNRMLIFGF